jgi:pimeloyl-ACP methyl ester carboxylesterase
MKVFVHGVPEVDAIWGPLVDELAARGVDDVVLLSPPGFGAPTPAGWVGDAVSYRDWLIDELERLRASSERDSIDAAIDLVGHDWGAGHVFAALAARPDLVRSFAVDCVGLVHPAYVWHDTAQAWQTPDAGEQVVDMMLGLAVADRTAAYEGLGVPSSIARAMAEAADTEMGRCILALYRSAVQPALADVGAMLLGTDLPPMLAIVAGDDPYVPAAQCSEMSEQLRADQLTLDGAGHWWMFDHAGSTADGLANFWSTLGDQRRR